jgi:putative selenium metabolism hydrolase
MNMSTLDQRIAELSEKYLPLAAELLKEAIRIPADYVDKPIEEGGDPLCGLSNHEGPRLEYLKRRIVEVDAVRSAADVGFDEYGNLVWTVEDPGDGIPQSQKRVIYYDGHTDTVKALRAQWADKLNGAIDSYDGLVNASRMNHDFMRDELGHLPPDEQLNHMIFGRGAADQLGGVIAQIVATKIALELAPEGALRGVIIRSQATTAEEDNDGAGPMYLMQKFLPGKGSEYVPDVVILTEGTGDASKGALGIYRGQRGRMQIEVVVTGRSCHGSMPWEGLNPLEFGGAIISEAAKRYDARDGFLDDPFLGHGTRTASWARLETPSDCAVPDRFIFRFDRRLTVGETPAQAVADVEALDAVSGAREAGLSVDVSIPNYEELTWKGYKPGNPQVYMGWATPEEHRAIQTAVDVYDRVVAPNVGDTPETAGTLRKTARVDRWIFSTDGVGFPIPEGDSSINVNSDKAWVRAGGYKHPPMFGFGPGIEQNTHKIGECVDTRELRLAVAFLARFPSRYVDTAGTLAS